MDQEIHPLSNWGKNVKCCEFNDFRKRYKKTEKWGMGVGLE